tara:strand:- start:260 stop:1450 length:1191 start_codon:yes stop_codon:yes gene_type:complete
LEQHFQQDKELFKKYFYELLRENQNNKILLAWKARFEHQSNRSQPKSFFFKIGLSILSISLFLRLPAIFLDPEWFFPRFLPLTLFLALAVYFQLKEFYIKNSIYMGLCSALFYLYVSLLPDIDISTSAQMSTIHLLPVGFSLAAFSFLGQHIMSLKHRIRFIGICGELFIISVLIGLGFIVFTLFAIGMLDQLNIDAEDWYMINFGLIAMVSTPFVAGFVYDQFFEGKLAIASLLSKIFAPLFTILAFLYLIIMLIAGNTPFENREFLILFNAFLILVLAMVSFTIIDQKENESLGFTFKINLALLGISLFINILALSAVIYRLFEYGMSPNRFVVIGLNIIIFSHLTRIMMEHVKVLQKKSNVENAKSKVVDYLPVYTIWSLFVFFALPIIFQNQ